MEAKKTCTGLTIEKFQQAVKLLEDNQPTLAEMRFEANHLYRMLENPKRYFEEESLKREITKTIKTHGYYQQRQGMLINENYIKWR